MGAAPINSYCIQCIHGRENGMTEVGLGTRGVLDMTKDIGIGITLSVLTNSLQILGTYPLRS